jgi:uncharacterized membrane protein
MENRNLVVDTSIFIEFLRARNKTQTTLYNMTKSFFNPQQQQQIEEAIKHAELKTSGEIRIHIENHCTKENILERAWEIFHKLGIDKTKERNGVIFYLAVEDKRFAILGDEGIHQKVAADFWDDIKTIMQTEFKLGRFTEGLSVGISIAGDQLQEHFPAQREDVNELMNIISFEEN